MPTFLELKQNLLNPQNPNQTVRQTQIIEEQIINFINHHSIDNLSQIITEPDNLWLFSLGLSGQLNEENGSNLILEFCLYPNIIKALIENNITFNENDTFKNFMIIAFMLFADEQFMPAVNKKYLRKTLVYLLESNPNSFLHSITNLNSSWFPQNYHLPIGTEHLFFNYSKSNSQIGMQIILDILINEDKPLDLIKIFANKNPLFSHLKNHIQYFSDIYAFFCYYPKNMEQSINQMRLILSSDGEAQSPLTFEKKNNIKNNILLLLFFTNEDNVSNLTRELLFSLTQFEADVLHSDSDKNKLQNVPKIVIQEEKMRLAFNVYYLLNIKIINFEIIGKFYQEQPVFVKYMNQTFYKDIFEYEAKYNINYISDYLQITQFFIDIEHNTNLKMADIQSYLFSLINFEAATLPQKEEAQRQLNILNKFKEGSLTKL